MIVIKSEDESWKVGVAKASWARGVNGLLGVMRSGLVLSPILHHLLFFFLPLSSESVSSA